MVQLERVWDGDLLFGVVVLSFAVQVNPDAGHCEGVRGLRLVDVRDWNTLQNKATHNSKCCQDARKNKLAYAQFLSSPHSEHKES